MKVLIRLSTTTFALCMFFIVTLETCTKIVQKFTPAVVVTLTSCRQ